MLHRTSQVLNMDMCTSDLCTIYITNKANLRNTRTRPHLTCNDVMQPHNERSRKILTLQWNLRLQSCYFFIIYVCVLVCVHTCVRWGARAHNICVEVRGRVHMSILRVHSNCCLRIEFSLACNFAQRTFVAYRAPPLSATHQSCPDWDPRGAILCQLSHGI